MNKKQILPAVALFILAFALVLLPERDTNKEIRPETLLSDVAGSARYLSVDQVTKRIIEDDPTLILIDLRPADQFKAFALPGAVNLAPDSLLTPSTLALMNQRGKDKVFISNADLTAEMAWLMANRNKIEGIYLLRGGMNEWFNTIVKEQPSNLAASSSDLDLVSFRKAARQYFIGAGEQPTAPVVTKKRENIQVIRKAPEPQSGGGC